MKTSKIAEFRPSEIQQRLRYLQELRDSLPEFKKNAISYSISFHEETQFYNNTTISKNSICIKSFKK